MGSTSTQPNKSQFPICLFSFSSLSFVLSFWVWVGSLSFHSPASASPDLIVCQPAASNFQNFVLSDNNRNLKSLVVSFEKRPLSSSSFYSPTSGRVYQARFHL